MEMKLDYSDVLIRPKRSKLTSRAEVDLTRTFTFLHSKRNWTGVPIVAANMDTIGVPKMANAFSPYSAITCMHKFISKDEYDQILNKEYIALTCGLDEASRENLQEFYNENIPFICLDVANGYTEVFVDLVKETRQKWKNAIIIAGNVVTAEMTEALLLSGADIVKVGIGPGSVCTTRKMTGVGYPQLSAVMECADAAHGLGGHIMADGGCTCPGDIAKSFGGGADFVMLGGMLSGTDESEGTPVYSNGVLTHKTFYGMSSEFAMKKHFGGIASHRASEGKLVQVDYKGSVNNVLNEILGGLRSACTYVGASRLKHLPKCTTFVRVNNQINNIFGA